MEKTFVEEIEEGKVTNFGDQLLQRIITDGRWLANHPDDSIENKHFIGKEVRELNEILRDMTTEACDEIDEHDGLVAIEELLLFTSRIYSRCSEKVKNKMEEYISEV